MNGKVLVPAVTSLDGIMPASTTAHYEEGMLCDSLPKYVLSTTLDGVQWNNSVLLRGDVAEEVAKLKCQPGNELQVHRSAALVRGVVAHIYQPSGTPEYGSATAEHDGDVVKDSVSRPAAR